MWLPCSGHVQEQKRLPPRLANDSNRSLQGRRLLWGFMLRACLRLCGMHACFGAGSCSEAYMTLCACSCRACLCLCCLRARACPGTCHGDKGERGLAGTAAAGWDWLPWEWMSPFPKEATSKTCRAQPLESSSMRPLGCFPLSTLVLPFPGRVSAPRFSAPMGGTVLRLRPPRSPLRRGWCLPTVSGDLNVTSCMTPKVRFLDGVVCVLLCVGLNPCRLHVVLLR